ncbi:hypothetical protein ACS0TY_023641 [Phlomoides rotata]
MNKLLENNESSMAKKVYKCLKGMSLEEEAEECLEDLVRKSLVLVTRNTTGEIKSCSLHDQVRDSCIRKTQEEMFLHNVTDMYHLQKCIKDKRLRHISTISHHNFRKFQSPTIHTFLCLHLKDRFIPAFLGSFRLPRVLDVVCSYVGSLPCQLFELIHLKYLALGTLDDIPAAISTLLNLQTLIINPKGSPLRRNLPLEIWRMQQLRHLVFPFSYKLLNPVDGSTLPLENLQTLSGALDPACNKKILKMIPNLKELEIYFENKTDHVPNFIYPDQLEKLKQLKKLSLVDNLFSWNDIHVIGSLPHHQVLKLRAFPNYYSQLQTWKTTDGEFPQLKFLQIHDSCLEHWITESSHFPRFKCLILRYCWSLLAISDGIEDIPTLELINMSHTSKSLADSAKQIQLEQQ